jgi:ketosteroid isomerase-like protein
MSEPKIESLQRVYWAVQRRDAEELSRLLSHDIEWSLPETLPWGGTHHGPAGVQTVVEIYEEHVEGVCANATSNSRPARPAAAPDAPCGE